MGSVPDLYTTGDNDEEIHPASYYRHYLYCDACGSFQLEPWTQAESIESIEKKRRWLEHAAWLTVPLLAVAGWMAFNPLVTPSFLLILIAGIVFRFVTVSYPVIFYRREPTYMAYVKRWRADRWSLLKVLLAWIPLVLLVETVGRAFDPPWVLAVFFLALIVVLFAVREYLGSKIAYLGSRCHECGATYSNGSPFYTDLDANPRGLQIEDVPRPLGSTPFEIGKSVQSEASAARSRLPT